MQIRKTAWLLAVLVMPCLRLSAEQQDNGALLVRTGERSGETSSFALGLYTTGKYHTLAGRA